MPRRLLACGIVLQYCTNSMSEECISSILNQNRTCFSAELLHSQYEYIEDRMLHIRVQCYTYV